MLTRPIPATQEPLPVIGLGTWQTFDVPNAAAQTGLLETLHTLHASGARVIDSSPMYGRAEQAVGELTEALRPELPAAAPFFVATKVWTQGRQAGIAQMEESMRRLRRPVLDLLQIHNLLDYQTHLPTLREWQAAGRVRYLGITHYVDGMHAELERVLRAEPVEFVQFNYSILDRHAEQRLLPAAADLGVATLINRPLTEHNLLARAAGKPLPPWAADWGIGSWPQFFLKFILGHPAVTCVIPATRNPAHLADNLQAAHGPLPDAATRDKMAALVRAW
ncbi:aldo/keto reductase [Hymenobacter busanensis]|uniref:Aldo/keto reductase n=1 Tax=Hymenobacter busanensis TaxID=2607656 RepID=A0A7L5A2W7_9BACT|nr:aldo/keto reductase [Hymenobacter busanensis]KAA9327045.1 aldo/keto reductase [Hymenobacter busanensis]QHJ09496.1 aldo/keto reductase [Hymenobacter busanensis]